MSSSSDAVYPLLSPLAYHARAVCAYDALLNTGSTTGAGPGGPRRPLQVTLHCTDTSFLTDVGARIRCVQVLSLLTGVYPTGVHAKAHHAQFGLRKDDPMGFQITLQGMEAEDLVSRLVHTALASDPTFRGISSSQISAQGDLSFTLKSLAHLPELEGIKPLLEEGCVVQVSLRTPGTTYGAGLRYLTERQIPLLSDAVVRDTGR